LMRNGRDRRSENSRRAMRDKERVPYWLGPISGSHQGQRPKRLHRDGSNPPSENRPDTWLHPNASLKKSDSSCTAGAVHTWPFASLIDVRSHVGFSNRPVGVKRFQTIHHHNVDVPRGFVLLFGIGTRALPSWDSKTRWNDLLGGLAVKRTAGPNRHADSPHPSSREGHHSTARWSSSVLLSDLILHGLHAAAAACSRVHRNSVPSTHMRCMITARRRASATIAFFIPRRLAICIAQALSQDHFFERSRL